MRSDFLGGSIAIISALASIFGVNLQKYSHDKEESRVKPRPYHTRPLWWVGMVCVVGASLGDFFALGFAPQTLVASLGGGSTILGNCLMSRFWLKQTLYYTDILGVALVTLGVVVLAAASEEEEAHYKMDRIYGLMQALPFLLYCLLTTAFVMTLYLRVRRSKAPALRVVSSDSSISDVDLNGITDPMKIRIRSESTSSQKKRSRPQPEDSEISTSMSSSQSALMSPFPSPVFRDHSPMGIDGELDDVMDKPKSDKLSSKRLHGSATSTPRRIADGEIERHTLIIDPQLPLYWAAISGTIGAQSVLLAKCVAEMISSTLSGDNQFRYFGTYVLVCGMTATLLTQTHTLNLATMSGDTMSAYPVFQAFWISMSNISGVIFFQQVHNFTRAQWLMFPSAIALVLVGITLVAKHQKFGNRIKYSIALPISLSSPRQHDIVAQSFVFRVSQPQQLQQEYDEEREKLAHNEDNSPPSPRHRKVHA